MHFRTQRALQCTSGTTVCDITPYVLCCQTIGCHTCYYFVSFKNKNIFHYTWQPWYFSTLSGYICMRTHTHKFFNFKFYEIRVFIEPLKLVSHKSSVLQLAQHPLAFAVILLLWNLGNSSRTSDYESPATCSMGTQIYKLSMQVCIYEGPT